MSAPHEIQKDRPAPDLRTRPMRLQARIGAQIWIVIAFLFVVFLIIVFVFRETIMAVI